MNKHKSWNNYPKHKFKSLEYLSHKNTLDFHNDHNIAYGLGRSYGDVCLNQDGNVIVTTSFNKIIEIDQNNGILSCESGISIKEVLNIIAPMGWFLPVVPGTRNVTIGGAIANDIHGKNHHKVGSFGNFVKSITLQRSNGEILICNEKENFEFLKATVGGMGLTGIILSAEIKLKQIKSQLIRSKTERYHSLENYFEINDNLEKNNEYTVSWVDCLVDKNHEGLRGVYHSGNHFEETSNENELKKDFKIRFPFTPPFSFVNNLSMKLLNDVYYGLNRNTTNKSQHFKPFFFPLDIIDQWGKAYGRNGFLQYQFVVPKQNGFQTMKDVLKEIKQHNEIPALGVLKTFGDIESIGYMSFPREGLTLALDFRIKGNKTFKFLERLDKIVMENNGSLYPAKDARMSGKMFVESFKKIDDFTKYIDPKFSSSFWRRVNI